MIHGQSSRSGKACVLAIMAYKKQQTDGAGDAGSRRQRKMTPPIRHVSAREASAI
jgi:hypothetical protein